MLIRVINPNITASMTRWVGGASFSSAGGDGRNGWIRSRSWFRGSGGEQGDEFGGGHDDEDAEDAFEGGTSEEPRAGADVDGGDLPAEQAEQHADGDLVDHRAGDQEAQGDSDRHAGGDETR